MGVFQALNLLGVASLRPLPLRVGLLLCELGSSFLSFFLLLFGSLDQGTLVCLLATSEFSWSSTRSRTS